jgi:hypothetical protein
MIDIEPLVASVEAFSSAAARDDRAKLLAQIRTQLETLGAADESASKDTVAVAEALLLRVISLQRYLVDTSRHDDPEAYALVQRAVGIVTSYVSGSLESRGQPIRVDAKQRVAPTAILRARPVEGAVDHEALSREFIARFPKIRAALAE